MYNHSFSHRSGRRAGLRGVLAGLTLALAASLPSAHGQGSPLEPRVAVGQCLTPHGTLLQREAAGLAWLPLGPKDAIHSRDLLLALPAVSADLEPKDGHVRLTLRGGLPDLPGPPVLESAVVLHDSRAYDIDFTLARGRVVLSNRKRKGEARAWVRLPAVAWELTLHGPGDAVALELWGRRPGVFEKDPQRAHPPTLVVGLHVLKGGVTLKDGRHTHALSAPPGPALLSWDSISGADQGPQRRQEVPGWADARSEEKLTQAIRAERKRLTDFSRAQSVTGALTTYLRSASRLSDKEAAQARRRLAVYALGALDDLQGLTDALGDAGASTTRASAVEALHHWIGRGPGQDQRLYHFLVQRQEYPEPQAVTVLELLHNPFDATRPETYETLIAYLRSSRLAVRELARWHLYRLAPAGKKILYDAAAPEADRQKAYEAWKNLIPSGKLPPEAPDGKGKDGGSD